MKFLSTLILILTSSLMYAQVCTIDYTQTVSGVYPQTFTDGTQGTPYYAELTILFPTEGAGVNYTSFKITSIELPLGLTWTCSNDVNGCVYNPQQDPFGCILISGTPAESGQFTVNIHSDAKKADNSEGVYTITADLTIGNAIGTNSVFTITPNVLCESGTVDFALVNPVSYTPIAGQTTGISYAWEFGNGNASTSATPVTQTYNGVGEYEVELTQVVDTIGFRLKNVVINAVGCTDPATFGNPEIYIEILDGSNTVVYSTASNPNDANLPQTYNLNLLLNNPPYSIRVMDDDDDNWWGTDADNCIDGDEHGATTALSLPNVNNLGVTTQNGNNGSLSFTYTIEKDTSIVKTTDLVKVHANPAEPILNIDGTAAEIVSLSTDDLGYVYHWELDGQILYDETGTEIFPTETGGYAVIAVNEHGCYASSETFNVSGVSGINDFESITFNIYPNPSSYEVTIDYMEPVFGNVMIFDLSGRMIYSQQVEGNQQLNINVSSFAKGMYTVSTQTKSGEIATKKLIVQ